MTAVEEKKLHDGKPLQINAHFDLHFTVDCCAGFNSGRGGDNGVWAAIGAVYTDHVVVSIELYRKGPLKITDLRLYDRDLHPSASYPEFTPLRFLSVSPHPYPCVGDGATGDTCVWGTITIEGDAKDELDYLVLQILDGGSVVAEAKLSSSAKSRLLHIPFGPKHKLEITEKELIFRLPSSHMGGIDQTQNGMLTLRAKAESKDGQDSERVADTGGAVQKLARYTGTNRYGQRDPDQGGDDWLVPAFKTVLDYYTATYPGLLWGDMSNMNGGHFSPHKSHDKGIDADGYFNGYQSDTVVTFTHKKAGGGTETIHAHQVTYLAGIEMVHLLDDPTYGKTICKVFVTFDVDHSQNSPFWQGVEQATGATAGYLADGRTITSVISFESAHDTHFHWRYCG
jgi:hypothetical protein